MVHTEPGIYASAAGRMISSAGANIWRAHGVAVEKTHRLAERRTLDLFPRPGWKLGRVFGRSTVGHSTACGHSRNQKIVIATHNKGKLEEFAALLTPYGVEAVSAGHSGLPEPAETENTFAGNARIKALAAMKASGLIALSDDSGLCVEALDGEPGVYTADWAGPDRDWNRAMRLVEEKLAAKGATTPDQRRA